MKLSLIGAAMLAASSAHARAEETPGMEIVVVSASRVATKLSETSNAIGIIDKATLEREKPKTMGDVLNRVAGVHWNDLGNEQHSMAIRQPIGTAAVYQYLEDGIPIRPLGVFNHNALNEMNIAGSDGVEVVKGPSSSVYGSNAVGGAINVLTAGSSVAPYARFGVRSEAVTGYSRVDAAAADSWGDFGLRFSHYSSRRKRDNWQKYSRGDKDSFTLRADFAATRSSTMRASLVHTRLDADMTGSLFEQDYWRSPGKSINSFTYRRDKATRLNLAWEGETMTGGLTTVTVFGRRNDHGQLPSYSIGNCVGLTCKGVVNNNHVSSRGIDVKHTQEFSWRRARLVGGVYVDLSDNPFTSDNLIIARDAATGRFLGYSVSSATQPTGVRNYEAAIDNKAAFIQLELTPIPQVRVVAGGRLDKITYDFRNHLAPAGSANHGAPDETRGFSRFSPKVGASYVLGRDASAYVNLSEGFTPPEVSQLYGKTGIPKLHAAVFQNREIGMRMAFLGGALRMDTALYRLVGKDTIVNYTIAPGTSENRNAGRTRSAGLEIGVQYDSKMVDARIATAIARHRFEQYRVSTALDYSGKDMPQAPQDMTTGEIGFKPSANARLAVGVAHQGRYWMDNANTVEYGGHTLWSLSGSIRMSAGWEAWFQVRNLANRRHSDSASSSFSGTGIYSPNTQNQYTPGAPRSIMLGATYKLGK